MLKSLTLAAALLITLVAPTPTTQPEPQVVISAPKITCATAYLAHTSGKAAECRRKGWQITPGYSINPRNILRGTRFRACATEDSDGCWWDARKRTNGRGDSFVASVGGKVVYVAIRWSRG